MTKNTGGSAFPGGLFETVSCGQNDRMPYNDGMTLRDYFAAKAMQSLCGDRSYAEIKGHINTTAKLSYAVADAMLHARENI